MKVTEQYKEFQTKPVSDLQEILAQKREQVRDLRFKISQNQEKDVRNIRKIKKEIAQILTILHAKQAETPVKKKETVEVESQKNINT